VLNKKHVEKFILLLEKMYSQNSQIVFTSDDNEKVIQAVARRVMRDKFAGGMMVAIHNS
jgi:chromosomal replication initiation ATPase DnaA